jgi:hypothetical protein
LYEVSRLRSPAKFAAAASAAAALLTAVPLVTAPAQENRPSTAPPVSAVRESFSRLARSSASVQLDLIQYLPGQVQNRSTGNGMVDYGRARSEIVFKIAQDGWTDYRQIGRQLFVESYNTPSQQRTGEWVELDARPLAAYLDWPPGRGIDDPTFLFASASLAGVVSAGITSASPVQAPHNKANDVTEYKIKLSQFHLNTSGEDPKLFVWLGRQFPLRCQLNWPLYEAVAGANDGATRKQVSTVVITISFSHFGIGVRVPRPPIGRVRRTSHSG